MLLQLLEFRIAEPSSRTSCASSKHAGGARIGQHDQFAWPLNASQRREQHAVPHAEDCRVGADAEREGRDHDDREHRISPDLAKPVTEIASAFVERAAVAIGSNAFLRLRNATEIEQCQASRFGGWDTVPDSVACRHVDKRLELVVQVLLGPVPTEHPSQDRSKAVEEYHAPSSTLLTANDTRFQRSRCCSS